MMKQFNNLTIENAHFESLYPPDSREKEIRQILTCIKSGNFNQTISLPGGGRSQALRLLAYNRTLRTKHLGKKEKLFHFVLCNFSEIRNKSLNDVLKFLYSSLTDSLASRHSGLSRIRPRDSGVAPLSGAPQNDAYPSRDSVVLFNALKKAIEHLTLEKDINLVFLFDNFDEYLPMVRQDFFKDLKILRSSAIYKFSTVFAVNRPLENLLDPQVIVDIYQFIADHSVYLNLYDKPSLEFRISFIEKAFGKTIKKENLEKIIALTGGHVNLTRICVETILESHVDLTSFIASDSNLAEFLLRHKSIQSTLLDIWESLTPAEQNILAYCHSERRDAPDGASRSRGISRNPMVVERDPSTRQAKPDLVGMTDGNINSYLENIGLLKNGKITISLLEDFLKQNPSLRNVGQQIVFDATTKEIKKGDLLISDKLTLFEYCLLKFLLQNPNRIVERDAIINAVWENEKSTAGVTDQALDQLIFRVRRKIEDDPNNPVHLQTMKGRGFRFTA